MIRTADDVWIASGQSSTRSCSRGELLLRSGGLRAIAGGLSWILLLGTILAWPRIASAGWRSIEVVGVKTLVVALTEDRAGNLWVGSRGDGVGRYDGVGWRNFTTADGLVSNYINAILEDRQGTVWVGTDYGLSRYDGSGWSTLFSYGYGQTIAALFEDRAGNIWVGTAFGGVSRYDGSGWRTYTTADGLGDNSARTFLEDRGRNIWIGSYNYAGVSRFDGVSWRNFNAGDGLPGGSVRALLEDSAGNIWVGMYERGGASRYDGSAWRTFTSADGLVSSDVSALLQDRTGNIWAATNYPGGGLSRYDGARWKSVAPSYGILGTTTYALLEDRYGNIWIDTDRGVSRYDGSAWRSFPEIGGLGRANALLRDHTGNVLVASGATVSRYDGSDWGDFTRTDGLASNDVNALMEDREGNFWFGTDLGVSRYDGQTWQSFDPISSGLGSFDVRALLEDRAGNIWAGTFPGSSPGGVSRYDGTGWRSFTTADSLGSNYAYALLEDHAGNIWVNTLPSDVTGGLSRYDGQVWRNFTTADGLADNAVGAMLADSAGNLWAGTIAGLSRFDGQIWRTFTTVDGLANDAVTALLQDRSRNLWVGTIAGLSRFDGQTWRTFTTADGHNWKAFTPADTLGGDVTALLEDRSGNLWVGAAGIGVSRYDGQVWRTFSTPDGLGSASGGGYVGALLQDGSGDIWVDIDGQWSRYDGTEWRRVARFADPLSGYAPRSLLVDHGGSVWFTGVTRYDPDYGPPRTVFVTRPPALAGGRTLTSSFLASFTEFQGVQFSSSLDAGPWSPWSPVGSWTGANLLDGHHTLRARARDSEGHVEDTPAVATFEVDATAPTPVIEGPTFGQPVRGTADLRGTAADARFISYVVAVRPAGAASWSPPDATVLAQSNSQVSRGLLTSWDTTPLSDGLYDLRLSVTDSLGLTGTAQVTVVVDNHFPFAGETTPAVVTAASGGNLYTTNQELHLYFPPHAFDQDALVSIAQAGSASGTLSLGVVQVLPGYDISWSGGALRKPATMRVAFSGAGPSAVGQGGASEHLAVYDSTGSSGWQRLGGTVESGNVTLVITQPGRYALFAESSVITGSGTLAGLAFTPRVFSPAGSFASSDVGISFTLGRPAPVTVRVYSRSGRLIREVVAGQAMNAGANLVRWDGRDRNGGFATDGLYLVTVEALGRTERKTLAVVK